MTDEDAGIETLLTYLKESRGFDFTGYKRASLSRRINRRLSALAIDGPLDYLDYLQVHPEEFTALFNTILINVTEFFRDIEAWDHLRGAVLPSLLASRSPTEPIRVWSAGCATGEEAYSLAIAMCEVMGADDFRERVKIYATDVDEDALGQARHAHYGEQTLANVSADLRGKYFDRQPDGRLAFRKELRRSVIIGRNDLIQDAPISRIDLLVCRNVLMYLTAETQTRVLRRFHFALRPDGFLFLGKAEMLLGHGAVFTPVDGKRRMFRKTPGLLLAEAVTRQAAGADSYRLEGVEALREETILAAPMPVVVVTDEGRLALASRAAEVLFGISQRDLGRAFRDLDLSYRPVELRQHIDQARRERRTVRIKDVEWLRGTNMVHLEIQITPLIDRSSTCLGTSIVFQDTSQSRRLRQDLELANRHLETAYEELQSTNEELETTNEELQSTVEELETTNEELQSTNEELETMNEELQSTNDELQTINEELRERTEELYELNDFLESVLTGLRAGVAVLDRELRVQVWNRPAEDLWGLRNGEAVGREFLSLEIGLPLDELTVPLRRAVGSGEGFELYIPSVNRFGKAVNVRVVGGPLPRGDGDNRGAIVVMDVVDHVKPAGATQASPS